MSANICAKVGMTQKSRMMTTITAIAMTVTG
jgi:hypothetical protein